MNRPHRLAMTDTEIDEFLGAEITCRVATVGDDGPHVTPLWFLWADGAVWLSSLVGSRRSADLRSDGRIAIVADAGTRFRELRGVHLAGRGVFVGEVPRRDAPDLALEEIERRYARKYDLPVADLRAGTHAWLRVEPRRIASWDYRKMRADTGALLKRSAKPVPADGRVL